MFSTNLVCWIDCSIDMKLQHFFEMLMPKHEVLTNFSNAEAKEDAGLFKSEAVNLDSKCNRKMVKKCANEQDYMTKKEHDKFKKVLCKYGEVFNCKLGLYPHEKFHLTLKQGVEPVYKKPYPVPYKHEEIFKK